MAVTLSLSLPEGVSWHHLLDRAFKDRTSSATEPAPSGLVHSSETRADDESKTDSNHPQTESGEIVGHTPIGRATVVRLGMNSEAQIAARKQWVRLGLFP